MDITFGGELFEWRGPAPFVWLLLPDDAAAYVQDRARETTYGWGAIPVEARLGGTTWETSLLPREDSYVLPVKKLVQTREGVGIGDAVTVGLSVKQRAGRAASTLGEP